MDEQEIGRAFVNKETGRVVVPFCATKKEVIVGLTLKNQSLRRAFIAVLEENDERAERIKGLEEKLKNSLSAEYFSSLVKRFVNTGKVPTPKSVLKLDLPITCICEPGDIDFKFGGVYA